MDFNSICISYSFPFLDDFFVFCFLVSNFSSDFNRRSTFFTSSPAGNCSGTIPRCSNIFLTAVLLSTCSRVIGSCPCKSFCCTFTEVISAAKSLALMLIVGRKSAKGRLSGAPNLRFNKQCPNGIKPCRLWNE